MARTDDAELVERRRAEIVKAATSLIVQRGYPKTGVADIAKGAKISLGLLYHYIRCKEDILFLIFHHYDQLWSEGLRAAAGGPGEPLDRVRATISFLVGAADENPEVVQLFYREWSNLTEAARDLNRENERRLVAIITDLLAEGVRAGDFTDDMDCAHWAGAINYLGHGWALKPHLWAGQTPESFADWILDSVIQTSGTPATSKAWHRERVSRQQA